MANNFQEWQSQWEEGDFDDIERHLTQQANTLSHFGRVFELFIPNALQTAAHLIGGQNNSGPRQRGGGRYFMPVGPDGKMPSRGGGIEEELPDSDSENR